MVGEVERERGRWSRGRHAGRKEKAKVGIDGDRNVCGEEGQEGE